MTVRTLCLHGPESTGKTVLAAGLSDRLGGAEVVSEYGREWCEANGTYTSMADLVTIATEHERRIDAAIARAEARGAPDADVWVILDTDAVMTAVWADMLHGGQDPWFADLTHTADLYLVPDIDLPWIDDGIRYFGQADIRKRFMDMAIAELEKRSLPYAMVRGQGEARLESALAALRAWMAAGGYAL